MVMFLLFFNCRIIHSCWEASDFLPRLPSSCISPKKFSGNKNDCMKIKMILPALTEAKSPYWRPIKYSLFPPLGLATLAAYCSAEDEIDFQDEHVEELNTNDTPDLVVI